MLWQFFAIPLLSWHFVIRCVASHCILSPSSFDFSHSTRFAGTWPKDMVFAGEAEMSITEFLEETIALRGSNTATVRDLGQLKLQKLGSHSVPAWALYVTTLNAETCSALLRLAPPCSALLRVARLGRVFRLKYYGPQFISAPTRSK